MIIKQLNEVDVAALGEFVRRQEKYVRLSSLADDAVEMLEERDDCGYIAIEIIFAQRGGGSSDLFVEHLGQGFAPLLKKFFRELSDEALRLRLEKEMEIHDPRG